jgi:hypothetical protein
MMKNFILSLVLLTILSGCLPADDIWAEEDSNLIFQSEYTNYAWGYNHNGWMLDNSGQVKRFQKGAKWVFPDSLGYISEADMQKNLFACDSVVAQIAIKDYNLYAAKAFACINGPMTKPQNKMADAGEHIQAFYLFDSGQKRYKRVILNMTGDWSQENLAADASSIVDWMLKIK